MTYFYVANSPLVEKIEYRMNDALVMTTGKAYDYLNRLTLIQSTNAATVVASYAYGHNQANQRTQATNENSQYWSYAYDDLGQVIEGKKRQSDGTLVADRQFECNFDTIGNRRTTSSNSVSATYGPNLLNQYETRTVGQTTENFAHDLDGNLTQDGQWDYAWDGENRLVRMVTRSGVTPEQRLEFVYDYRGRRLQKKVWNNRDGTGNPVLEERYVYDGWNLLAILNSNFQILSSFAWGLDLSGTLQGAGGVGGLLVAELPAPHAVAYDGNGNVMALVGDQGTVNCRYEYGPFAETYTGLNTYEAANPFRFSTKFQDAETGLLYYGYRYLRDGRWLSRDPIEERGGVNVYAFLANDCSDNYDVLGLGWKAIVIALLEGAGVVVDKLIIPDFIDDKIINKYGGPELFMDVTEKELASRGGDLPRDMFRKARAKNKAPINRHSVGNEKVLYDKLRSHILASKIYQNKYAFILTRLKQGTAYRGFVNIDFQDAGEASLGYAIGGAQLHYLYRVGPPPTLLLQLKDTYDFTNKGHMWGRLQDEGYRSLHK